MGATRNGYLVLTRQITVIRITVKEISSFLNNWTGIEEFIFSNTCDRAPSNVPNGVTTASTRGQTRSIKGFKYLREVIQFHSV